MTNDCKTCPVSTGSHKPADAVHQIDEPQSEALRLAAWLLHRGMSGIKQNDIEASNQLRWLHAESLQHQQELAAYRFTVENRDARIRELEKENSHLNNACAELEAQLEAIGAGGVEPLRKRAAAPQAAVPLFWVRLLRDGLYEGPVHNNSVGGKMLRDEKPGEWHPLYLHAAPAYPAEGVPAQNVHPVLGWIHKLRNGKIGSKFYTYEPHCDCAVRDDGGEKIAVVAATHPTQQGLDAQTEAARSVLAERARQVAAKGWTPERDDEYTRGILGEAGGIYALHAFDPRRAKEVPEGWPWDDAWWKPKDPRTNLVKAGALILAEIERMDRSFAAQAKQGGV